MEHLSCLIFLSLAQSLRGGDIYGKLGNYPKSMGSLSSDQRIDMGRKFIEDTQMHRGRCSNVYRQDA